VSGAAFFGSTLKSLSGALSRALVDEETARRAGVMQSLDPRVRVLGVFLLVIAVVLVHKIAVLLAVLAGAVVLALASSVSIRTLVVRVWLVGLALTGILALPALFLTPGEPLAAVASITRQGLHAALMLITRVETAVTFTTMLVLTTPWTQILKALRWLGIPKEVVMMLAMAYRYIFVLSETATQMFESRESRRVGVLEAAEQRHVMAQTAGVLMSKSLDLSQEVFLAMQSRGYRGDARSIGEQRPLPSDYFALLAFVVAAASAIWWGR
jgi:cobalt ECF transporter T component CbiQ